MTVPVPGALLAGFAEVWCRLAGGRVERSPTRWGSLHVWRGPTGERAALPDRMYGLDAPAGAEVDAAELPSGLWVHLPPGVTAPAGEVHCLGHHLVADSEAEAWAALRRVGRQGVKKARRLGGRSLDAADADWLRLATHKAEALGGRAPHPQLVTALRDVFGSEAVHLRGVAFGGDVAAVVLALSLEGYGVLVDGASDRAQWDKNPNNLAVWSALLTLLGAGCRRVDYGFSPVGAGDGRFKDHMGGREVPLVRVLGSGPG